MGSWGGKCWLIYDEALVKRVILPFFSDCLDCWDEEVGSMNVGKVGAPFKYPHSFISNLKDIGRLRVLLGLCLRGLRSLGVGYPTIPLYGRGP